MKWIALVLILLLIVIIFGIWRRLQADRARIRTGVDLPPPPSLGAQPPPTPATPVSTTPTTTTPAAEASADEVPRGPAHEERPDAAGASGTATTGEGRLGSEASPTAEAWWRDEDSPKSS